MLFAVEIFRKNYLFIEIKILGYIFFRRFYFVSYLGAAVA